VKLIIHLHIVRLLRIHRNLPRRSLYVLVGSVQTQKQLSGFTPDLLGHNCLLSSIFYSFSPFFLILSEIFVLAS
jgi:hypothetical protein